MSDSTHETFNALTALIADADYYDRILGPITKDFTARAGFNSGLHVKELFKAAAVKLPEIAAELSATYDKMLAATYSATTRRSFEQLQGRVLARFDEITATLRRVMDLTLESVKDVSVSVQDNYEEKRGDARKWLEKQIDLSFNAAKAKEQAAKHDKVTGIWTSLLTSAITLALSTVVTLVLVKRSEEKREEVRTREARGFEIRGRVGNQLRPALDSTVSVLFTVSSASDVSVLKPALDSQLTRLNSLYYPLRGDVRYAYGDSISQALSYMIQDWHELTVELDSGRTLGVPIESTKGKFLKEARRGAALIERLTYFDR